MNTTVDRIERAYADVVAVEEVAPGLMRVCTWSDQYVVDARGDGCGCPDKMYNLDDTNMICKHRVAAIVATRDDLPGPWDPTETLDTRDGEARGVMADGGREYPDSFEVVDHDRDNRQAADTRPKAEKMAETAREFGSDNVVILDPADGMSDDRPEPDGGTPEVVDNVESDSGLDPAVLAQDPIDWLRSKNTAFVNTISGTPAISKQGFRFIQQQFGITTESEVVETFDDPLGVIVWAKAERPDGQSAEAHGEGYQFEGDLRDNEFVRYADTRAKNRAISDLTSAGALAVSELTNEPEGGR